MTKDRDARALSKMDFLEVYSDGASRGNPGPAAIAFMILSADRKMLKRHSKCVGVRTNNQAEYEALISALEFASTLPDQQAVCHIDSELVVKQLNGEYRVRNQKLKILWRKANALKQRFKRISFKHVSRTNRYIQEVDQLANEALG